jgi:hypothetical protein
MLDERDRRAWADLERRLLDDTAPRFLPAARLSPGRSPTPARWLPYVMAVVVPLPLPAISVMEMRPSWRALAPSSPRLLCSRARRSGAATGIGCSGLGNNPFREE